MVQASDAICDKIRTATAFDDQKLSPRTISRQIQTVYNANDEPSPFPSGGFVNKVESGILVRREQELKTFCEEYSAGAVPASKQIYTVPTGKKLYVVAISCAPGNIAGVDQLVLRDAIADAGTEKFYSLMAYHVANSTMTKIEFLTSVPIKFENGIRIDAADQTANQTYIYTIVGWVE